MPDRLTKEIKSEVLRQRSIDPAIPPFCRAALSEGWSKPAVALLYAVPSFDLALKRRRDRQAADQAGLMDHAIEHLSAVMHCYGATEPMRRSLVKLAATCVRWIEDIDTQALAK